MTLPRGAYILVYVGELKRSARAPLQDLQPPRRRSTRRLYRPHMFQCHGSKVHVDRAYRKVRWRIKAGLPAPTRPN